MIPGAGSALSHGGAHSGIILGLSYNYHDAAACLVRDGLPLAAAEEERFSRRKHDTQFPERAIAYCLREAGVAAADLDGTAFYEKPARKLERALLIGKQYAPLSLLSSNQLGLHLCLRGRKPPNDGGAHDE